MRCTLTSSAVAAFEWPWRSRTSRTNAIVLLLMACSLTTSSRADTKAPGDAVPAGNVPFMIDADYPGGNIVIERIDGNTAILHQDRRDTQGWWFYWNFRARRAAGRTITFKFTDGNPIGVRGPAVSTDAGKTWDWLGTQPVKDASFEYKFAKSAQDVRFCFAIPYQHENLTSFLSEHAHPNLKVAELCKTRKGRSVEKIRAGKVDGEPNYRILVTARHHACEMIANYALEGLLEAVLADNSQGLWLRQNVEILAVPFMDKDGVEDGDQGKNRRPHDHNRDYIGRGIYPSVAALRSLVPKWSNGKPTLTLDLHCPYIRGPYNEVIYIVGSSDQDIYKEQIRFGECLQDVCKGPLPYDNKDILPFGKAWNTNRNYDAGRSCSRWAADLDDVMLAASFEIPYANVAGNVVTADAARAFGRDLAAAMFRYLSRIERPQALKLPPDSTRIREIRPDLTPVTNNPTGDAFHYAQLAAHGRTDT